MKIKRIGLHGFGVHGELVVELPERGLVLVHGPNGVGKSTIIEAIAAACWAESMRGERLPREVAGQVAVELFDGTVIRRMFGSGRDRVEVVHADGQTEQPVTATKAAPLLAGLVGDWGSWRRTHVLSVHDAQGFSLATDRARKEVLEGLLGLERFEVCAKVVSGRARDARATARAAAARSATAAHRLRAAEHHATELTRLAPPAPAVHAAADIDQQVVAWQAEATEAWASVGQLDARARSLRSTPPTHCPTCAQPWPVHVDHQAIAREAEHVAALLVEASARKDKAAAVLLDLQTQQRSAIAAAEQVRQWTGAGDRAAAEVAAARAELEIATAAEQVAIREATISEALVTTFAPTGPRADILRGELERVAASASRWVGRIADQWVVELPLGTTGRQVDAIQLAVGPSGNLRSYRSCSNGERRRVDVGLCLALRDLGARAGRSRAGTLFADDVFDGLDPLGVSRLVDVLREAAEQVCVVVLAPSSDLLRELNPVHVVELGQS